MVQEDGLRTAIRQWISFFTITHNPERRYLWRWAGLQAPDLLLEVRAGQTVAWEASATAMALAPALRATLVTPPDSFLAALGADLSMAWLPTGWVPSLACV